MSIVFYLVLLGFTEFSLVFNGFYCVSIGFIGFYLDLNGFY